MDSNRHAALPKWQTPSLVDRSAEQQIDPEVIRRQAEAEGYAKGMENGRAEIQRRVARLQEVLDLLERPLRDVNRETLEQLTELSVSVARAVVQQELTLQPSLVCTLVEHALGFIQLDSGRHLRILLNPADVPLLREHLSNWQPDCQWSLVPDEHLQRGQCLLNTGHSTVDGSVDARLEAVLAQLIEQEGHG